MTKCGLCGGLGKCREPTNKEKFNELVDWEMDKAYMVNHKMAEEKAYEKVGFIWIDCPRCGGTGYE